MTDILIHIILCSEQKKGESGHSAFVNFVQAHFRMPWTKKMVKAVCF